MLTDLDSGLSSRVEPFGGDNVAPTAAMLADPARVAILWAVSDGRALPAGELAFAAGLRATAASAHLAKLVDAGLLQCERQGRHRYYRLRNPHIISAMEALAVATQPSPTFRRARHRRALSPALRTARSCYDHLAGCLGVSIAASLVDRGALRVNGATFHLAEGSSSVFAELEIDLDSLQAAAQRTHRPIARACLDWSERQYHVAGALGAALLQQFEARNWLERTTSRSLSVTHAGRRAFRRTLGVQIY